MSAPRHASLAVLLLLAALTLASAETVTITGVMLGPDDQLVAGATVFTNDTPPKGEYGTVGTTVGARVGMETRVAARGAACMHCVC
jgi:hypothetical protein